MICPSASSEKALPLDNPSRQRPAFSRWSSFLRERSNGVRDPQQEQNPDQKAEASPWGRTSIGADTFARADASFMDRFF
jgi:hypothetical protein